MVSEHSSVPAWAGTLLLVLVLGALALRVNAKLAVSPDSGAGMWAMQDFRNAVYYPAVAVHEGVNPYDRKLYESCFFTGRQGFPAYSPLSVLLHAPFRLLPYQASAWAYFVLVAALTLCFAFWTLHLAGGRDPAERAGPAFFLAAALLASRPGYMNIFNGQITMPLVLGSLAALEFGGRRPVAGGLGLALATLKPTYAVPLAVVMLARGQFRAVVVGTLAGSLGAFVSALWIGAHSGGLASFVQVLIANVENSGAASTAAALTSWTRVDVASLLARAFHWEPGLFGSIWVAAVVLVLAVGALRYLHAATMDDDGACGLAGLIAALAVLIGVYHQPYDVLLVAPMLVALLMNERAYARELSRGARTALIVCLGIPFANYVATDMVLAGITPSRTAWLAIVSIDAAALTLAFAIAVGAALAGGVSVDADGDLQS